MKIRKGELILLLGSVLFTLGALEASSHFFAFNPPPPPPASAKLRTVESLLSPAAYAGLQSELDRLEYLSQEEFDRRVRLAGEKGIDHLPKKPPLEPLASFRGTAQIKGDPTFLFDVPVHEEENGRRVVPRADKADGEGVAFMGDSFVYGIGVADEETLPAIYQRLNPHRKTYNLGVPSFGPNEHLFHIDAGQKLYGGVHLNGGTVYYLFPAFHSYRANCSLANYYGGRKSAERHNRPLYEITDGGGLRLLGDCSDQTLRHFILTWLGGSHFVRANRLDWPPLATGAPQKLVARIMAELRDRSLQKFGAKKFVVVINPGNPETTDLFLPYLKEAGVEVLNLGDVDLRSAARGRGEIPGDWHPTGAANRVLGYLLSEKN